MFSAIHIVLGAACIALMAAADEAAQPAQKPQVFDKTIRKKVHLGYLLYLPGITARTGTDSGLWCCSCTGLVSGAAISPRSLISALRQWSTRVGNFHSYWFRLSARKTPGGTGRAIRCRLCSMRSSGSIAWTKAANT